MSCYSRYITICICLFMFFACNQNDELTKNPYEKEVDGIVYSLKYIPTSFLINKDLKSSKDSFESIKKQYEDHYYFKLNMNTKTGQNIIDKLNDNYGESETLEIINQISFHSKKKLKLRINDFEVSSVLYHLDKSFVELNGMDIMVVFRVDELDELLNSENNVVAFKFENNTIDNHQIEFLFDDVIINQLNDA